MPSSLSGRMSAQPKRLPASMESVDAVYQDCPPVPTGSQTASQEAPRSSMSLRQTDSRTWMKPGTAPNDPNPELHFPVPDLADFLAPGSPLCQPKPISDLYHKLPPELQMEIYPLVAPLDSHTLPAIFSAYSRNMYREITEAQYPRSATLFPLERFTDATTCPDGLMFTGQDPENHLRWIKVLRSDVYGAAKLFKMHIRDYLTPQSILDSPELSLPSLCNSFLVFWHIHGQPLGCKDSHEEVWKYLNWIPLSYLEQLHHLIDMVAAHMSINYKKHSPTFARRLQEEVETLGVDKLVLRCAVWNLMANAIDISVHRHIMTASRVTSALQSVSAEIAQFDATTVRNSVASYLARCHPTTSSVPNCVRTPLQKWEFKETHRHFNPKRSVALALRGYVPHPEGCRGDGSYSMIIIKNNTQPPPPATVSVPARKDKFLMFNTLLEYRKNGIDTTYGEWARTVPVTYSYAFNRKPYWHWMHWNFEDGETVGIDFLEINEWMELIGTGSSQTRLKDIEVSGCLYNNDYRYEQEFSLLIFRPQQMAGKVYTFIP